MLNCYNGADPCIPIHQGGIERYALAKDAGHGIKKGTKKAYHKTKHGTKKAYHKTGEGVEKVGDKMEGKPTPQ